MEQQKPQNQITVQELYELLLLLLAQDINHGLNSRHASIK